MKRWRILLPLAVAGAALGIHSWIANGIACDTTERLDILHHQSGGGAPVISRSATATNEQLDLLLNQSFDSGQITGEWRRPWMNDQPSHMSYERVHGGIGPGA